MSSCWPSRRRAERPLPWARPAASLATGPAAARSAVAPAGAPCPDERAGSEARARSIRTRRSPEQELREHARLQRELAAVGGKGFDLAHNLPGHVAADDALTGPHVSRPRGTRFAGVPGRAPARRAPGPRPANLAGGAGDRTRQVRSVAATTSALRCRCPKNSPTPSRPSRSRRPPLPSCRTCASPDKIKNSSAATSPCSTTYEPGGYQRTWTWSRMWPMVLAASASTRRAWAKAGVPTKRSGRWPARPPGAP